jgi:hypothetical protein
MTHAVCRYCRVSCRVSVLPHLKSVSIASPQVSDASCRSVDSIWYCLTAPCRGSILCGFEGDDWPAVLVSVNICCLYNPLAVVVGSIDLMTNYCFYGYYVLCRVCAREGGSCWRVAIILSILYKEYSSSSSSSSSDITSCSR